MIPIFLTVLCIGLIVVGHILSKRREYTYNDPFEAMRIVGCIFLIFHSIIWFISGISSVCSNGGLIADQKNLIIFGETAKTINELAVIKDPVDSKLIGGLENMQQSSNASKTLIEYRDRVVAYNESIAMRKVARDNFLLRYYVVSLPKDIEMIDFDIE